MPYIGNNHIAGDHTNNFKVLDDISSYTATFDGSATSVVDTTNNTIRVVEHRFIQGQRVTYTNGGGGNIGGLTTGTAYFIIHDSASTFKLATSASNAASSTAINLSAVGSGSSHTLNAAFDGVNTKFKLTHSSGTGARLNNATQVNVAINNVLQKPNQSTSYTEGFIIEDNHKIAFKTAPTSEDIFWGSIIANTLTTFDISDHKIDTFTGDGSTTEFNLSHTPANNESLMVTINGVLQHPSNASTARAYTLIANVIQFTAAPGVGDEIQVRHMGFAGATTSDVTGFYGRTGNVVLTSNDHITTGDITSRNINASGILTASSASFGGNVSIGGTLTYEDVSNIDSVGLITARDGIFLPDSKKAMFGNTAADPDLEIYHGGTASYISHSGTGNLFIHSDTVALRKQNQQAYFVGVNGQSKLYESGSERLVTTDKGITVGTGVTIETNGQATYTGIVTATRIITHSIVGIASASPTHTLEVGGSVKANAQIKGFSGNHAVPSFTFSSAQSTGMYLLNTNGTIGFSNAGTHTATLDNNGKLSLLRDLDVDGHTNLDNVSIAGVTTTTGNIHLNSGAKVGFATDSNTFIGQDDYDRLDFNVGGKRLASIVEGTNIPVLVIDKDGINNARSNQNTNYNANPNATELVLGNTSSNNHGMTIVSPSSGYGNIQFSDGSGGGLDSTRGTIVFTHSDNKLNLKSKIGSIALTHKDDEKLVTTDAGISIPKDLDVDGHTNLDNVSIAGVTTFTGITTAGALYATDFKAPDGNTNGFYAGGSDDLHLFHNGADSYIENDTGNLTFTNKNNNNIIFKTTSSEDEKLRITSGGSVNIGGNFTQTTYTTQITSGNVNKKIGFGAAAHNDLSNEGSGIFFSRQSDGADGLSGIFAHTNTHLGLASRGNITFHAGGSSNYGSAPQRMALDTDGRLYLGSNFTGGNSGVDDLVISGTGAKGITLCSTDGGITRFTFADGLSGTAAVIGSIAYEHSVDAMDFYTNALRMMRVDRANSTERLQIGSTNNSSSGTRLVLGSGNNIAATAVINTQDTNINALTLSNWDGSTTTNKVNMHFDCSGIAGFDVGIPAQTPDFKISNTSGGGGYINMKSTGETKIYRSGVMLADINNSVQGHQFISQSNDNEDGFEVYNQHGSTTSRYTFACYDNRSGSKGRSFGVRGDGKSIFYGDILPSADIAYDLGSDSYTWEKFYYKNAYPEQSTEYRITSGSYSNGQWHDTAFGRDSMGGLDLNGVYIVTAFADLYTAMGGNYQCNYTWIVGIRNQYTNQTLVNTCPLLSVTGHSTNNFGASGATVGDGIRLGTSRTPASQGGEEQIVWRPAASTGTINNTAGRTLVFRCQRIGRSSLG